MDLMWNIRCLFMRYWPVNMLKNAYARINSENMKLEKQVQTQRQEMLQVLREVQAWKIRQAAR